MNKTNEIAGLETKTRHFHWCSESFAHNCKVNPRGKE